MKKVLFAGVMIVSLTAGSPAGFCGQEYTLEDLYRISLQQSEQIKITAENIRIAEAGKDKAVAGLLPRLSTFGSYTGYTTDRYAVTSSGPTVIQPDGAKAWGVRLDQSLYVNGRDFTNLKIARGNVAKSRLDLDSFRESYLLSVASAYYDVMKAKKALEIADANLDRLRAYRNAASTRLRVGEVTKTALLRAEGELSGALSDRIKAKNSLGLSKAVLARTVGIAGDFELKEPPPGEMKLGPLNAFLDEAAKKRTELQSLELQKKIAEDQVRYAKGGFWPTVSIAAGYTGQTQNPSPTTLVNDSTYGTISLNYPFFEGGLRKAEVNEAKTRRYQAELSYRDTLKSVQVDVENAYLDVMTQQGILKFLRDQLVFAKENYNAVLKQFEFGLSSSIDVIDANNLLLSAQRQLADAVYNYQLSQLRLKRATGVLLEGAVSRK